jgi:DTW domain-containing protein YfiP
VCEHFKKLDLKTRVDLVVHYKELKRTSNTGRLIQALLKNQKIWIRGQKDQELDHSQIPKDTYNTILLYPSNEAKVLDEAVVKNFLKNNKPLQIIVPDGNWRQASKVHYRVKEFKKLPRYKLNVDVDLAQRKVLRIETKPSGLSTIEAIGHMLGILEGDSVKNHILNAFEIKKTKQLKRRNGI